MPDDQEIDSLVPTRRLQLHAIHERLGASFVEDLGFLVPDDYGDADREQQLAHRSVGLVDRSYRGVLDLTGPDVIGFLRGILPSGVMSLEAGAGQPSCLLSPKGRILELFELHRIGDGAVRLVFSGGVRPAFVDGLGKYAFLSDVSLTDRSDAVALLSLEGAGAPRLLEEAYGVSHLPSALLERVEVRLADGRVSVVRHGESPEGGYDFWVPRAALEAAWEELHHAVVAAGGGVVGLSASEALRIEAGIPRYGKDCDEESFLDEVGLGDLARLDHCYVGQEIVARMRTYGHANWRLRGAISEGEAILTVGEELIIGDEVAGRVTSWGRSARLRRGVGLTSLHRAFWDATQGRTAAGVRVELVDLPIVARLGT